MKTTRNCLQCSAKFTFETWKLKWMKMLYCSRNCANKRGSRKGKALGIVPKSAFKKGCVPNATCFKKGLIPWNKGIISPLRGANHPRWQGGKTAERERMRKHVEYIAWRTAVFIRDNRECIWCHSKKRIEADHIKPYALYPKLRLDIDNGRTLCHDCHTKTPTYLNPSLKTVEQFERLALV